jgi:Isy1-like splicing family
MHVTSHPCPAKACVHMLRAAGPLQVQDSEGKEIRDGVTGRGGGYRYFGAAKQLPGVRELFEKEPPRKVPPLMVKHTAVARRSLRIRAAFSTVVLQLNLLIVARI